MKVATMAVLALLVVGSAKAQTYQQSTPTECRLGGVLVCVIPLAGGGNLQTTDGVDQFQVGATMYFMNVRGTITSVGPNFPAPDGSGNFAFTFQLSDGRQGTVSGHGEWVSAGRGHIAKWDSSTTVVSQ